LTVGKFSRTIVALPSEELLSTTKISQLKKPDDLKSASKLAWRSDFTFQETIMIDKSIQLT